MAKKSMWTWILIGGAGLGIYFASKKKKAAAAAASSATSEVVAETAETGQGDYIQVAY